MGASSGRPAWPVPIQRSAGRWARVSARIRGARTAARVAAASSDGSTVGIHLGGLGGEDGGDEETRTPDPLLAKEMLCQLSYVPAEMVDDGGGRFWTRTRDLCLIRAAL